MTIRQVVDWVTESSSSETTGKIASAFYQLYDDANGWVWACDVDLGDDEGTVLSAVPVAANNRELIYAQEGSSVVLSKTLTGTYQITGLSKVVKGKTYYSYLTFEEDAVVISRTEVKGYTYRVLTLGEIGTLEPFGTFRLQPRGKFDADGAFVGLMGG
jgi:hypothetical protein